MHKALIPSALLKHVAGSKAQMILVSPLPYWTLRKTLQQKRFLLFGIFFPGLKFLK